MAHALPLAGSHFIDHLKHATLINAAYLFWPCNTASPWSLTGAGGGVVPSSPWSLISRFPLGIFGLGLSDCSWDVCCEGVRQGFGGREERERFFFFFGLCYLRQLPSARSILSYSGIKLWRSTFLGSGQMHYFEHLSTGFWDG